MENIMKLKNKFIALMLLLCSTQTHKPMSPKNDLSLRSLLNCDDSFLSSFTGEDNMLTESQDYDETLTGCNPLMIPVPSEPLGSTNITLNIDPVVNAGIAPVVSSKPSTKKRKQNFSCDHCDLKKETNSALQKHIASHFPVDTVCPFDNCHEKLSATTINSLESHFIKKHIRNLKDLGKPLLQLASQTYHSALQAQGGIAQRTAKPIRKSNKNKSSTLTREIPVPTDKDGFELPPTLPVASLSVLLAHDDSFSPSCTDKENTPTKALPSEFQSDLTAPAALLPQSGPTDTIPHISIGVAPEVSPGLPTKKIKKRNVFPCDHCGKILKKNEDLQKHTSTHLPVTITCPFPSCEEICSSGTSLIKHLERFHKEDLKAHKDLGYNSPKKSI